MKPNKLSQWGAYGQLVFRKTVGEKKYKAIKAKGMKGKTWKLVDGRRVISYPQA